jgi:hypothetical protein
MAYVVYALENWLIKVKSLGVKKQAGKKYGY